MYKRENQKSQFCELLNLLLTEKGREIAIAKAVKKGISDDPLHIRIANSIKVESPQSDKNLPFYIKAGMLVIEAEKNKDRFAKQAYLREAVDFYEVIGDFDKVAEVYRKMGDNKKADAIQNLADLVD